jgi:hypothetical protein
MPIRRPLVLLLASTNSAEVSCHPPPAPQHDAERGVPNVPPKHERGIHMMKKVLSSVFRTGYAPWLPPAPAHLIILPILIL